MLELYLGNRWYKHEFERGLSVASWCMQSGRPFSIILNGPTRSGKSTILNVLQKAFESEKNVWFVHDFDASKGFFGGYEKDDPQLAEFVKYHPVIFAATNKLFDRSQYENSSIFFTTGERFSNSVYKEMVKVCEENADDIYRYYAKVMKSNKVYRLTLTPQRSIPRVGYVDLHAAIDLGMYSTEDDAFAEMMGFIRHTLQLDPEDALKPIGSGYNWKSFSMPGIPHSRYELFTITEEIID